MSGTRFHLESWRKLYRTLPPSWLMLPLSARGLGDELIKYVDDTGVFALPAGEPMVDAVCRIMSAHRSERARVAKDLDALLDDGYLIRGESGLVIRNFVVAQGRTPGAKRMADMRERNRASYHTSDVTRGHNSDVTVTRTVTSRSDGSDTTRHDETRIPPPSGDPLSEPKPPITDSTVERGEPQPTSSEPPITPPASTAEPKPKRATRCPSSTDPKAPAWLAERGIPPLTAPDGLEVAKMLDHFAAASGARGTKLDWLATWRNWKREADRRNAPRPSGARPQRPVQPATKAGQSFDDWFENHPRRNEDLKDDEL